MSVPKFIDPKGQRPCCVIAAGEPSGDLLGADLARHLRDLWPELIQYGVVGPQMREQGVNPLGHIDALSVMGFVEVLKHFSFLKIYERNFLEAICRLKPQFVVFIDYPGLHIRLAEQVKMLGIPVVQYVAPQLWAWGKGRTEKLGMVTNHVLGIMPFETEFFRDTNVNYTYVGTPQVDRAATLSRDKAQFGLNGNKVIGFFPGSRKNEIIRMLEPIRATITEIRQKMVLDLGLTHPIDAPINIVLSMAPSVPPAFFLTYLGVPESEQRPLLDAISSSGRAKFQGITIVRGRSLELMGVCDAALVTSGTATLECALAGTPLAVAYRLHPLSFRIAMKVVKVKYISLVNLVANKLIVREFIQNFAPKDLASWLMSLCFDNTVRGVFHADMQVVREQLQGRPGRRAAEKLCALFQRQKISA